MAGVLVTESIRQHGRIGANNAGKIGRIGGLIMGKRIKRLVETFIAKKYVAWLVAIAMLWHGKISGTDWVMLTGAIFAIDAYSKTKLAPREESCPS